MNIPQVPPGGWTPVYLAQLNQVADSIIPHQDTTHLRNISEEQLDAIIDATHHEWHVLRKAELAQRAECTPETWLAHRIANRRYDKAVLKVLSTLKEQS